MSVLENAESSQIVVVIGGPILHTLDVAPLLREDGYTTVDTHNLENSGELLPATRRVWPSLTWMRAKASTVKSFRVRSMRPFQRSH